MPWTNDTVSSSPPTHSPSRGVLGSALNSGIRGIAPLFWDVSLINEMTINISAVQARKKGFFRIVKDIQKSLQYDYLQVEVKESFQRHYVYLHTKGPIGEYRRFGIEVHNGDLTIAEIDSIQKVLLDAIIRENVTVEFHSWRIFLKIGKFEVEYVDFGKSSDLVQMLADCGYPTFFGTHTCGDGTREKVNCRHRMVYTILRHKD